MKIKHLIWIIPVCLILGLVGGVFLTHFADSYLMGNYDLYNCIYSNADLNEFNQHPVMIQKIQDECVCFREHNYTNLLYSNCWEKKQ